MFFKSSRLTYSPESAGPNVLALSSNGELSDIRIRPFLSALLARGVIASYQMADRRMDLQGWLRKADFTHIWCHRNVSTAQYKFLKKHSNVPIIYDIDDLLMAVPDFVMKRRSHVIQRIDWCFEHAMVVTTATGKLHQHLYGRVPSETNVIILKNGYGCAEPPRRPPLKKQIVWTSGDLPFVLRDHAGFMGDLAKIANRHDYEMIFIGRFDPEYGLLFNRHRHIQRLDFTSYREFLYFCAGAIALVPLPSGLSTTTQQFFDAKSDIKLVDYLSSGIVPVCTSTTPYSESELFIPRLAALDPDGLLEKLETCIVNHAGMIEYVDEKIHEAGVLKQRQFFELSKALDPIFEMKR